ncbi:MAG: class I SAM-dependent methyltransferase [Actinomycetota bacterium]
MSSSRGGATPTDFDAIVFLGAVVIGDDVAAIRSWYVDRYGADPEDRGGWYTLADWRRISFVNGALGGSGRFLDVGLGAGQFLNAVARSHAHDEVHGLDRVRFKKYVELDDRICRHDGSIAELPYPDDHFDVVTCMEVLEHLPSEFYADGIAELRRVCRGQLVMSVPFEEPEPIYGGHVRRYEMADLARDFPDADLVLLDRPGMSWALMEEWFGTEPNPHRLRRHGIEEVARTRSEVRRARRRHAVARRLPAPLRRGLKRLLGRG